MLTTLPDNTPKHFCLVGTDTRDLTSCPTFYCKAFPTRELAEEELFKKVMNDIDSVMGDYELAYDGDTMDMSEFKEKHQADTRLKDRVAWFDYEGGVVEYTIHEVEYVFAH